MEINLDIVELEKRVSELDYSARVVVKKMREQVDFTTMHRIEPIAELVLSMALYDLLKSRQ